MLANPQVHPTLPVVDMQRARRFYEDKIGLKAVRTDPSPGVLYEAGSGSKLYIYQRAATKADHTEAAFEVEDVEAMVSDLKSKGVAFEEIDAPQMGIKTVDGVATMGAMKSAWFKYTEGNILAVSNMAS